MSISYLGMSSDGRTGRWRIKLSCGHSFEPKTTMFSTQNVDCKKCGKWAFVDYNEKKVIEYDDIT